MLRLAAGDFRQLGAEKCYVRKDGNGVWGMPGGYLGWIRSKPATMALYGQGLASLTVAKLTGHLAW